MYPIIIRNQYYMPGLYGGSKVTCASRVAPRAHFLEAGASLSTLRALRACRFALNMANDRFS